MQSQLSLFPSLQHYGLFCIDSCHASPFQFQVATFKKVRGHIHTLHSPPHSGHTLYSGSSEGVCRSCTQNTTSSETGFPEPQRPYKGEHGCHRPYLHPR